MGTKILNDIRNDIKQLITSITGYEENQEGFKVCEKFCMSHMKHHRFLSVNSHATKEAITGVVTKLSIHGKYKVSKKFQELVDTFLLSFDFEQHPQYDLQWSLLTFLLDLAKDTYKSDLECLKLTRGECTFNTTGGNENDITEEIDWGEYLKEGQEDFFCDYKSDSESEWSDEPDEDVNDAGKSIQLPSSDQEVSDKIVPVEVTQNAVDRKLSLLLEQEFESRTWLLLHTQNTWWNELDWRKYPVESRFCDAHICEIWHKVTHGDLYSLGTLSEYQVCRELLWMFHVQTSMAVFQYDNTNFSIRPNISIPSLTTVAFNSIHTSFCKYFSMMYEMEKFGTELYSKHEDVSKKPPLTYESYNAAIKQHVIKFKTELIDIEKNLMKQETSNTFLSLSAQLKQCLNTIQILYDVHQVVVSDWKSCQNWQCASKLLSNLYLEVQKSHSKERTNICINLYLSSLTVYLNIIDTWLSEGRLEDWRNEFVVVRLTNSPRSENNSEQYEAFAIRSLDSICLEDPLMQFLIKKVQHMGQSIDLLVSLDRITDIWKVIVKEDEIRKSLTSEFYTTLEREILKYVPRESEEEMLITTSEIDGIMGLSYDEDIEQNVIEQLSEINNPFLMKAFENFLPVKLLGKDYVDSSASGICNAEAPVYNLFESIDKVSQCILPYRKLLENTLAEILVSRYNSASKLVKNIMIEEYKLETHLLLMRSVYMMEAGHIMSRFYKALFHEIENNPMWCNSYFLSCILEEVLCQQWPDTNTRWSVTVCDTNTQEVLSAVENITLHYSVGWPMNILLNEKTFIKYNEIFRFQLKLKWALWTLNNLRFSDIEGIKCINKKNKLEQFQIRRLQSLRFWLLHAIGSIHVYLSGQVLQNLGHVLEKSLKQADSLDMIISVHSEYLRKVHEHCLLTSEFEDLMATINNLIDMCNHVRNRWKSKKLMFEIKELDIMESSYIKYHTYLALALHSAVQNKDANYYELIPNRESKIQNDVFVESNTFIHSINNLSRSLLMEIAHQYLPPSGLPIPIPRLIHRTDWYRRSFNSEYSLPNEISLNEYEQTFSYIRWYQHEESFIIFNSNSYVLQHEIEKFIERINNMEMNLP